MRYDIEFTYKHYKVYADVARGEIFERLLVISDITGVETFWNELSETEQVAINQLLENAAALLPKYTEPAYASPEWWEHHRSVANEHHALVVELNKRNGWAI
jgi:hypothetical protein